MFSANKFDSFKQSLASAGKNSQTQGIDGNKVLQGSQTTFNNMNINMEPNNPGIQAIKYEINNMNGYNINSAIVSPKNTEVMSRVIYNSGMPNTQNISNPNQNSTANPVQTIVNYNFGDQRNNNNNNNISNANQTTTNRGTIRSALKFDYGMKIPTEKVPENPSMNIFSWLDNPNYKRDFQVTPKLMHK